MDSTKLTKEQIENWRKIIAPNARSLCVFNVWWRCAKV